MSNDDGGKLSWLMLEISSAEWSYFFFWPDDYLLFIWGFFSLGFFWGWVVYVYIYFFSPESWDEDLVLKMLFMAWIIISGSAMKIKVLAMLCQIHFLEEVYKCKCSEESNEGGRMFSVFPVRVLRKWKRNGGVYSLTTWKNFMKGN